MAKVRQIPLEFAKSGNFSIFWQPGWQPGGWLQGSTHSTFHELVDDGMIVRYERLRGSYRLNESLLRLGLRPVSVLPTKKTRSNADMLRLAFSMIEPRLFPTPGWALDCAFDPFQEDALK